MIANLTTPLLGIVATIAIGRLGDATLLGGVAMASVIFDCLFWLFAFLRMSTVAFTAQALGAGEGEELRALLVRGFVIAALIGGCLIVLQIPLAAGLFGAMGGSEGVTRAAKAYFSIRIWSAPLVLANYVVLGWLIGLAVPRAALLDRAKLLRMMSVNRDIMIRTAALIAAFLFFTAQGARAGDVTLAANAVLNNFLLISAFFLDGLANAAEQLCGRAYGARDRIAFSSATRLVILWGFAFALGVTAIYALFGGALIDIMTASADVRLSARDYLWLVVLAPVLGVFAFAYDGIFIGATWARDMRNLMMLSLLIFLSAWLALRSFGNTGLWGALLVHYAARGGLQALRYPALLKASFG
jgi:MATE family multidrug resistance protein